MLCLLKQYMLCQSKAQQRKGRYLVCLLFKGRRVKYKKAKKHRMQKQKPGTASGNYRD